LVIVSAGDSVSLTANASPEIDNAIAANTKAPSAKRVLLMMIASECTSFRIKCSDIQFHSYLKIPHTATGHEKCNMVDSNIRDPLAFQDATSRPDASPSAERHGL
jgi:hypothetical protein